MCQRGAIEATRLTHSFIHPRLISVPSLITSSVYTNMRKAIREVKNVMMQFNEIELKVHTQIQTIAHNHRHTREIIQQQCNHSISISIISKR